MIKKLISEGVTSANCAALDFAIIYNIPPGGWIPKSRKTINYNLKIIGITVVVCFLLSFISARTVYAQTIEIDPTSFDYGDVFLGSSSASQNFVIRNTGRGLLRVTAITLTDTSNYSLDLNAGGANACGSTTPRIKNSSSCNVAVIFNPSEVGVLNSILRVTTDDADDNQFDVDLTGRGVSTVDKDEDGMADVWEQQIIDADPEDEIEDIEDVNPDDDFDGDGVTNLQEFRGGTSPINSRPDVPVLSIPANGATEVKLTPQLAIEGFSDPEGDDHLLTRWQISTDPDFEDDEQLVFDLISDTDLTSLMVPVLLLSLDTEYFWRAAVADSTGQESGWSDAPFSFTTDDVDENDMDSNGIPDDQEVDCTQLFGEGGVPANTVCVNSATGGGLLGLEGSTNVSSIEAYRSVDPADIPDTLSGIEIELGLMSFKVVCENVGNTIEVIYHLSEPIPAGSKIYKWHPNNGWREHTNAEFLPDEKSVLIRITDGGEGDLDNVTNGIVIDPSGVGAPVGAGGAAPVGGGGGGDDEYDFTCFIRTVRFASPMKIEWLALILLMGYGIIVLHKIRKKD